MKNPAALATAALMVLVGVVFRDVEAAVIGLLVFGALAMLRVGNGVTGRVAVGVLLVDIIGWMAPAAWIDVSERNSAFCRGVPLVLVVSSLAGLFGVLRVPKRASALATAGLVVVALVAVLLPARRDHEIPAPGPSVAFLNARSTAFSASDLTATGPDIAIVFHNKDLFWHTVTIDELGVNLRVATGDERVARLNASPGTYEFYCAIPGHKSAGMKGTLVVS